MAGHAGRGFGQGFGHPMHNPSQPQLSQFWGLHIGLVSPPSSTLILSFFSWIIPLGPVQFLAAENI
jgi:hypothetical protein